MTGCFLGSGVDTKLHFGSRRWAAFESGVMLKTSSRSLMQQCAGQEGFSILEAGKDKRPAASCRSCEQIAEIAEIAAIDEIHKIHEIHEIHCDASISWCLFRALRCVTFTSSRHAVFPWCVSHVAPSLCRAFIGFGSLHLRLSCFRRLSCPWAV